VITNYETLMEKSLDLFNKDRINKKTLVEVIIYRYFIWKANPL